MPSDDQFFYYEKYRLVRRSLRSSSYWSPSAHPRPYQSARDGRGLVAAVRRSLGQKAIASQRQASGADPFSLPREQEYYNFRGRDKSKQADGRHDPYLYLAQRNEQAIQQSPISSCRGWGCSAYDSYLGRRGQTCERASFHNLQSKGLRFVALETTNKLQNHRNRPARNKFFLHQRSDSQCRDITLGEGEFVEAVAGWESADFFGERIGDMSRLD
jgi:hypothetical protein